MRTRVRHNLRELTDQKRSVQNVRYGNRYGNEMARTPDLARKPALVAEILEYFEDKPLSSLSFRTLAKALDVSTYTLVYQFGNRAQLMNEIVEAIAQRQKSADEYLDDEYPDIDRHLAQVWASFEWTLDTANLKLQRLEFEAAMIEALDPTEHTFTRNTFAYWMEITEGMLLELGVNAADAALEARILNNTFYGFQYDLVVNQEPDVVRRAFSAVMERYRDHLTHLIERSV